MNRIQKTIGIIGGMGPLATADLFSKLINMTAAECDREHIHIIIDNNPSTPDRTKAILYGGESPLPYLTASAHNLVTVGADFLIIPCITSHYYMDSLRSAIDAPIISIIEETAKELLKNGIKKVALLATDGTGKSRVFDKVFSTVGIEILYPSAEAQKSLMGIIYDGVKAGATEYDTSLLNADIDRMGSEGAEAVILGCTELPLAAKMYGINGKLIDPTDILAKAAIKYAGYDVK